MRPDAPDDDLAAAIEAAERWAAFDPDPVTRGAIDRLIDGADPALVSLFEGRLQFGTAGLRATVGIGPNRMNALVVRQTTVGVVRWLQHTLVGDGHVSGVPVVLIGFDARRDSKSFAAHAAAAVVAAGGRVVMADGPVPTPVVAHAVLEARADAAVVITASHNPPDDNGYKLYLGDGMQIVSPIEDKIADEIGRVAAGWATFGGDVDDAAAGLDGGRVATVSSAVWLRAHRDDAVAAARVAPGAAGDQSSVRVVYTPMHGVGGTATLEAFAAAGLAPPTVVERQFEPDPAFPTVAFPNPEEPGALDDAVALAERTSADLIVAHDPDADRLAVAARDGSGAMQVLSGDELGVLFGDHLLTRLGDDARRALVARSVVSGRMLDAVAEAHGAHCAVTLTGFKWIARAALDHPEREWCFGYEEAIGYAIGSHVRDKDGITAALVAVDIAQQLAERSSTLWDRLDELAAEHGVYLSAPVSVRFDDEPGRVDVLLRRLVEAPPTALAGVPVAGVGPIGGGALPSTPGLELHTDDRTRVIVRPSGTEPKLKAYLEVVEPVAVAEAGAVREARAAATRRLERLRGEVGSLLRA